MKLIVVKCFYPTLQFHLNKVKVKKKERNSTSLLSDFISIFSTFQFSLWGMNPSFVMLRKNSISKKLTQNTLQYRFLLFNTSDSRQVNTKFADDWIRTAGLWYWKQLNQQMSHHHNHHCCPTNDLFAHQQRRVQIHEARSYFISKMISLRQIFVAAGKRRNQTIVCRLGEKTQQCQY